MSPFLAIQRNSIAQKDWQNFSDFAFGWASIFYKKHTVLDQPSLFTMGAKDSRRGAAREIPTEVAASDRPERPQPLSLIHI